MRLVMIGLLLMLVVGLASAADPAATVSLQFTGADVLDVLSSISQQGQVSVVADATVKGKVSCGLSGMTVAQALDVICKGNNLEWYKAYAGVGAEKPSATKLFKLMDALKDLGATALICQDPKSQAQTVFVPDAGSVDNSAIASELKLKEIYLIRAIPDPAAIQAEKDKAKAGQGTGLTSAPPADPQAAAQQVWGYIQQMPQAQAFEAMHQLRHMAFDSLTPEQRQAYSQQFGGRGGRGGPNAGQNGQNPNPQGGQDTHHQHSGQ